MQKQKLVAVALLVALCAPAPVVAAAVGKRAAAATQERDLARLIALAKEADTKPDLARVRDAWQAVVALARQMQIDKPGSVDQQLGLALTTLASTAQADGKNVDAERYAREAVGLLRPSRVTNHNSYVGSLAIIAWVQNAEGRPTLAAQTLDEATAFSRAYVAGLSEPAGPAVAMAGSNIEFALAQIRTRLGELDKATTASRASWSLRRLAFGENNPDVVAGRYNYALALLREGREAEAEAEARAAVAQAEAHVPQAHTAYTRTLEALALILARVGRRGEAASLVERSIEIKRRTVGPDHVNTIAGLMTFGDIALQRERYGEARTAFVEAAAGYRKAQGASSFEGLRATLLSGLAGYAAGDRTARATLEEGVAAVRARDPKASQFLLDALPTLVLAREDAGDRAGAQALALDHRGMLAAIDRKLASATAEADALVVLTAPRDATWRALARTAAARTVAAVRDEGWLTRSGELSLRARSSLEVALRLAVESDDHDSTIDAMTVLTASRIASASRARVARMQAVDPALALRVREVQDAAEAYRSSDAAWLRTLATAQPIGAIGDRRAVALRRVESARAAIERDYPQWVDASGRGAVDLTALRATLGPDRAILGIVPAFGGLFVTAITRDGVVTERSGVARTAAEALVGQLRAELMQTNASSATAATLDRALVPPSVRTALSRVRNLRVVAADVFAAVPYAMLPYAARGGKGVWLDRFALATSAVFASPAEAGTRRASDAFLGIGTPTPFGPGTGTRVATARTYFRSAGVDGGALASLPVLPAGDRELQAIARSFPPGTATLLTGDAASEDRLDTTDLSRFSTILFATHGLVSGEMEGIAEPALVLAKPAAGSGSDGVLTASEVSRLRLDADWVILSACNTAAGAGGDAPAFSGLAQGFRMAGARALLMSHWPVRDDIAARMTIAVVRGVRGGLSHADALRRAMLAERRRHPRDAYLWAPFILAE